MAQQLAVFQPERVRDPEAFETIRQWQPDLGVVAAYGQLLPEVLLQLPRLGMINVHASLLPKYRGAAPIQRAVMDGARETGVTIMRMVKALDAGAMLDAVRRPITTEETSADVEASLAVLGAALLVDTVNRLSHGPVHEKPQNESQVTYARRLSKAEGLIDWNLPAAAVHDRVRGLYPWPHAYTHLNGERLILLRTSVEATTSTGAAAGTITGTDAHGIHVATGAGGQLAIRELQVEGRRPMTAREFLIGHPLSAGSRFDPNG
jgi:methionyl-tRNA formyltransferase